MAVAPPDRPLPRRADEPQRGPPPHRGFEPPGRPPPPREGDLYARNRCDRSIDIAWSYRDRGGRWHTVGWSSIDPGATRAVLRRPSNRVLYLHAADGARPAAHDGARHRRRLAVVDAAFDHVDGQAASSPGWRRELFHQFTMPANGDDLVVAFDCPAGVYQVRAHNRCNRTIHVAMH